MMVKGISKQVIVVHAPDPQMFEQAIFILKDDHPGVSEEALLKEARRLVSVPAVHRKHKLWLYGPVWACMGALMTGLVWLIVTLV